MTTPQERIETQLKESMKARDTQRVSTLRMLLAQLKNQRIADGQSVDEASFTQIVRKLIKQRQEAAELYDKGGREELAQKERSELETLTAYLPEPISEETLRQAVTEFIESAGLEGPAAIGRVMKEMTERFDGQADNRVLSTLARQLLQPK